METSSSSLHEQTGLSEEMRLALERHFSQSGVLIVPTNYLYAKDQKEEVFLSAQQCLAYLTSLKSERRALVLRQLSSVLQQSSDQRCT
jgi:hypothetical protein